MNHIDERVRIMEKIEALLNKTTAKGATEAEAEQALLMAQKLMAKYHINEQELGYMEVAPRVYRKSTGYKAMANWSIRLLHIIADNFRCKSYLLNKEAAFVGEETDSTLAVELYKMVFDIADRGTRKIRKQYRKEGLSTNGVADSYLRGFIDGLKKALEDQKTAMIEESSCMALVLATPQSVLDNYSAMTFTSKAITGRRLKSTTDQQAYGKGFDDGQASLNKHLKA